MREAIASDPSLYAGEHFTQEEVVEYLASNGSTPGLLELAVDCLVHPILSCAPHPLMRILLTTGLAALALHAVMVGD